MKIPTLFLLIFFLTGCGSTLVNTKEGVIHSSVLKKELQYDMTKVLCSAASKNHAKGHLISDLKLPDGTHNKVFMPPTSKFDMSTCMREGTTSNAVRIAVSFVGLGKVALKYGALYKSASSFLDSTRSVSTSVVTNNTSSNTDISANDESKIVTGEGSKVED